MSIPHPNGPQIVVVLLVLGIIGLFVYFHISRNNENYSFIDTLVDSNGHASIGKHFAWIAAVLAVWLIMVKGGKDPETAWSWTWQFLLTGLGYRLANTGIAALASRPPATPAAPAAAPAIGQQVVNMAPDGEVPIPSTRVAPPPSIRVQP